MTVNPFPLVRGPWIAREYYNREQPENFHDGRLVTGDVAKIDSEAYLIIANRSKDLIKTGGEWISSVDLEHHIVAIPGVSQACVVAAPHPKWDERPIATLILDARSALVPHRYVSFDSVTSLCATATEPGRANPLRSKWMPTAISNRPPGTAKKTTTARSVISSIAAPVATVAGEVT